VLLDELVPLLKDKDLMIALPQNQTPTEELKQLAPLATSEARIYVDYMSQEANSDAVNFASRSFSIIWVDDKTLDVSAMKIIVNMLNALWKHLKKLALRAKW
jgi:hypothetical protein